MKTRWCVTGFLMLVLCAGSQLRAQTLTALHSFGGYDGRNPQATLTLGSDGNLYGTTFYGAKGYGTVFKVTTAGVLSTLFSFSSTNGANPNGLTLGNDGNFYGTTYSGGKYNDGTVFQVTTNGIFNSLVIFNGTNGNLPEVGLTLIQGNDGNFYGTTGQGGANGDGTVFKVTTNGILTTLAPFNFANGEASGSLTLGNDGNFYGTAQFGGSINSSYPVGMGTVFKVTTNGNLTGLVSFNRINGAAPNALTLGNDGNFYGTTGGGGSSSNGTIFKVTTSGTLTSLISFNGTNGEVPGGVLTLGNDGNFYGTTFFGGNTNSLNPRGMGTVFEFTTSGTMNTLVSFSGTNGANPNGLTLGTDGNFYGTTYSGGIGSGTVFCLLMTPIITLQPQSQTNNAGNTVTFFACATNLAPFGYQWQKNGSNLVDGGNISGSNTNALSITNISDDDAAIYSVIITNFYGSVTSSVASLYVMDLPSITNQPQPLTVMIGHNASFEVTSGGSPVLAYQWFFNGTNLDGATNTTLTLQNVFPTNAGSYAVVITNAYGSLTSNPAMLTVLPLAVTAPTILANGQFQFSFDTATGVNYAIQYSTNLTQWFPFVTLGGIGAPLTLTDPNAAGNQQSFYRIILSPQ